MRRSCSTKSAALRPSIRGPLGTLFATTSLVPADPSVHRHSPVSTPHAPSPTNSAVVFRHAPNPGKGSNTQDGDQGDQVTKNTKPMHFCVLICAPKAAATFTTFAAL